MWGDFRRFFPQEAGEVGEKWLILGGFWEVLVNGRRFMMFFLRERVG